MREDVNGPVYKDMRKYKILKRIELVLGITIFFVATVFFLGASVITFFDCIAYDSIDMIIIWLWIQIWAIPFLSYGWFITLKPCTRYEFSEMGIIVKYPLGSSQYCSWDEFQQVCICYSDYATRGNTRATSVICCVKKGEEKNGYGRWKTDNPFRYKSVITIDYTDEMYEKIKEKYPHHIPDLRRTPAYRIER